MVDQFLGFWHFVLHVLGENKKNKTKLGEDQIPINEVDTLSTLKGFHQFCLSKLADAIANKIAY